MKNRLSEHYVWFIPATLAGNGFQKESLTAHFVSACTVSYPCFWNLMDLPGSFYPRNSSVKMADAEVYRGFSLFSAYSRPGKEYSALLAARTGFAPLTVRNGRTFCK
jgi:hypothetical protein